MNRRNFIQQAGIAAAVLMAAPGVLKSEPRTILYGDGAHDDTEALQAWFDGEPVYRLSGKRVGRVLTNGDFRVDRTIYVRDTAKNHGLAFTGNYIRHRDATAAALTFTG